MPFEHIQGQTRPLNILQRMLQSGNMPHAFLLTGMPGVGKFTTARGLARALNCAHITADFCGTCTSCRKINAGTHPDITVIEPEKDTIKIELIRTLLQNMVVAPVEAARRTVIINRAECMNRHTANCLLKTLEEPPPSTVIILVAHGTAGLLPTVLSRCQIIRFAPLSTGIIQTLLEQEGVPPDTARAIAPHAHGSMQRARLLLDDTLMNDFKLLTSMISEPGTLEERLDLADRLASSPERLTTLLVLLQEWYRDLLLCGRGVDPQQLFNADCCDELNLAAQRIHPRTVSSSLAQVSRLMRMRTFNINMQLGMEALLLRQ